MLIQCVYRTYEQQYLEIYTEGKSETLNFNFVMEVVAKVLALGICKVLNLRSVV
jgi:hypothetical protein